MSSHPFADDDLQRLGEINSRRPDLQERLRRWQYEQIVNFIRKAPRGEHPLHVAVVLQLDPDVVFNLIGQSLGSGLLKCRRNGAAFLGYMTGHGTETIVIGLEAEEDLQADVALGDTAFR